jgi:uncharacterized protein
VRIVDGNVLLYAVQSDARHHTESLAWLTSALGGIESVLMPWTSVLAFLRISTHPAVFPEPLTVAEAVHNIRGWLSAPNVLTGEPDRSHLGRVMELLEAVGVGGNLVNDAHLAALALQYEATVVSYDNDFSRFPGVRWQRPTPPG